MHNKIKTNDASASGVSVPPVSSEHFLFPDQSSLRVQYEELLEKRKYAMNVLQGRIEDVLSSMASLTTVKTRVKGFKSFYKKYLRLMEKRDSFLRDANLRDANLPPLITDIIGLRVICPFMEDLAVAEKLIKDKFEVVEVEHKGEDHNFREFGYESIHILIKLPDDILDCTGELDCEAAEIQIRTILQDAWAEVEHELIYKSEFTPFDEPLKRKLAAVNASLSLADIVFQEIRGYIRNLDSELDKRRESFFRKIEESTEPILYGANYVDQDDESTDIIPTRGPSDHKTSGSIDDLLLSALSAHNRQQFVEATYRYTCILDLNPDNMVRSLVYKHRGMAFFAQSRYQEAIGDFRKSLELDPGSYKSAYCEGIILSVLRDYPRALEAFNLSLSINPYQPYCLYRRGQAYFHLEDYPKALADCEAAIALEPFEAADKFRQLILTKLKL